MGEYTHTLMLESKNNGGLETLMEPYLFFFFLRLRDFERMNLAKFWGNRRMGLKWVVLGPKTLI